MTEQNNVRDNFFWLGQINKATILLNKESGLLSAQEASTFAKGVEQVLEEGNKSGAERPYLVITFEPLLIKAAGDAITKIHAGRSSQDMLFTLTVAKMREQLLSLADALQQDMELLLQLADRQQKTILPNYTNGVAAQPNSYAHYLLGFFAGFQRDFERLQQYYARLNYCPMGSTVLNGTSWPLNREKMALRLGFIAPRDNTYDAVQIYGNEYCTEAGYLITSLVLHISNFIADIMLQYSQPRPWILLKEGGENTYVSSAMPQKRNPGLLNRVREQASTLLTEAVATWVRAHNVPTGMADTRNPYSNENVLMVQHTINNLMEFAKVLNALVVDTKRCLEELNLDWTATQEVADVLMREYKIPFRVGHHFASQIVGFARPRNITPLTLTYEDAKRIYKEAVVGHNGVPVELPMDEKTLRATLNPVAIVQNRAVQGGPQPAEIARMLAAGTKQLATQQDWIQQQKEQLTTAEKQLNNDFAQLLKLTK